MYTVELPLNAEHIMEDQELKNQLREIFNEEQNRVIILEAPQGTGKSKLINQLDHIYLSPTKLLVEQQYSQFRGVLSKGVCDYYEYTGAPIDEYGDAELDGINVKTTFASSNTIGFCKNKWFVIDEVHKLCDFSVFANESITNTVNLSIDHYNGNGNLLFISATPRNFIDDFKGFYQKNNIEFNLHIKIQPNSSKKYINTLYVVDCKTTDGFFKIVKDKESKNATAGKQIGLLSNKDMIKNITSALLAKGLNVVGIDSENRQKPENEEGTKEYFDKLVETKHMTHQIMNFTSFVDSGVSFEDDDIENLFCMMPAGKTNITTAKQFLCRARNSKPNAYMKLEYLDDSEMKELKFDNSALQNMFENYAKQQIAAYQCGLVNEKDLSKTVGIIKVENEYVCSSLAVRQKIRSLREKEILSYYNGFKETFKDYYEHIELLTENHTIEDEKRNKAKLFLSQYIGKIIGIDETSTIIEQLNNLGIEGKKISILVEKVGFKCIATDKKGHHRIFEKE